MKKDGGFPRRPGFRSLILTLRQKLTLAPMMKIVESFEH